MSFAPSDGPEEPPDLASGRRTGLVVDPDRVARRAVEVALEPFGWAVEGVKNGAAALELLQQEHVDAIVAEVTLDDMPGRALMDRAWEVCGARLPPIVFLSSDTRLETRTSILRGGADAYLTKPFAPEELRAYLDGFLIRRNRERHEPLGPTVAMAGQLDQIDLVDLLAVLEHGNHTGVFEVAAGSALGRLTLRDGRLLGAEFGSARGEPAFHALLRSRRGYYRFEVRPVDGAPTINRAIGELIAEAVRRDPGLRMRRRSRTLAELGVAKRAVPLRRRPPTMVKRFQDRRALGQRLIGPVADRYLLGELSFEEPDPQVWDRLYDQCVLVELWAGLREGVAALLEIATPPGQGALVSVLTGTAQGLRLHLTARGGASMVVRLVDIEGSEAPPRRHPLDLLVVAPPHGELLAISPPRLAELALLATMDRMPWVVAMGGAALHTSLGRLAGERASLDLLEVAAALGERRGQLREALVAGLRRWVA